MNARYTSETETGHLIRVYQFVTLPVPVYGYVCNIDLPFIKIVQDAIADINFLQ